MYCSASLREQSLSCMTFLDRRSPVSGSGADAGRCRGVAPLAGRAALRVPADSARGGREARARSGGRGWPSAGRLRSGRGGAPSRGALPVGRGCAGPSCLWGGRLPVGRAPAGRAALARGAEEGAEAGRGAGVAWRAGVCPAGRRLGVLAAGLSLRVLRVMAGLFRYPVRKCVRRGPAKSAWRPARCADPRRHRPGAASHPCCHGGALA